MANQVLFRITFFIVLIIIFQSCYKDEIQNVEKQIPNAENTNSGGGLTLLSLEEYEKIPLLDEGSIKPISNAVDVLRSNRVQLNTPPVWSQGTEGSCVAFAVGYVGLSYYMKMIKSLPYTSSGAYRSPEFLYNNSKIPGDCKTGTIMTNALNFLKSNGACSWSQMPYSSNNGCTNKGTTTQKNQAKAGRIKSYTRVSNNINTLRNLLTLGYPIIIGIPLDRNFDTQTKKFPFTYTSKGGPTSGGHAMVIVGYDNQNNRFIVQNSWGTNVHDKGFLYISYNLMPSLNPELYYINPS